MTAETKPFDVMNEPVNHAPRPLLSSAWDLIFKHVFPYWKTLCLSASGGLVSVSLNVVSVSVFAMMISIMKVFFSQASEANAASEPSTPDLNSLFSGFSTTQLMGQVENAALFAANTYGILPSLFTLSLAYITVAVVTRGIGLASDFLILSSSERCAALFSKRLLQHTISLSLDFFYRSKVGDLSQRLVRDANTALSVAFNMVGILFSALPISVFYLLLLLKLSPLLTLTTLGMFAIKSLFANIFASKFGSMVANTAREGGRLFAALIDLLSTILVVKVYGGEHYELEKFSVLVDARVDFTLRQSAFERTNNFVQSVLQTVTSVAVVLIGVTLVISRQIEILSLILFIFVANKSQEPARRLLDFILFLHSLFGHAERVLEIARETPTVIDGHQEAPGDFSQIEFRNVAFHYRSTEPVITDLSFVLRKGEVLGLVGKSGSGKSTILALLLRLYDPSRGQILLDGVDIRNFTQATYRRLFGFVGQDPILFNTTVRDNIAYSSRGAFVPDNVIEDAARVAHVDEFANEWPERYGVVVGDRGVRLSGGQKQRISLARAILRDTEILVLDEATSSLDTHSETLIQEALDNYLRGRTAVISAHRLSTLKQATRIMVFEAGRMQETGTHEQLMALKGRYFSLYGAQSRQNGTKTD